MMSTKSKRVKKLSDTQLKLIILLGMGYKIGVSEDSDNKIVSWLEYNGKYFKSDFRKDTVNRVLESGYMDMDKVLPKQSTIYYRGNGNISRLLSEVDKRKVNFLRKLILSELKSGR